MYFLSHHTTNSPKKSKVLRISYVIQMNTLCVVLTPVHIYVANIKYICQCTLMIHSRNSLFSRSVSCRKPSMNRAHPSVTIGKPFNN